MLIEKPGKKPKKHKRTNACDITQKVKKAVWQRDSECCIVCGNPNAMPNAHYVPRSKGGLGIEQNVVTLCQQCHHDFDNGCKRQEYKIIIKDYLYGQYPDWSEDELYYKK